MNWIAIDSTNKTIQEDVDYPVIEGAASSWVRFLDDLYKDSRHLTALGIKAGESITWLPPNADYYSLHYEAIAVIGSKSIESYKKVVISAYFGSLVISYTTDDEEGYITSSFYSRQVPLAPSPCKPKRFVI